MDSSYKSQITAYELYRFIEWVASAIFAALLTVWVFLPEELIAEKFPFILLVFPSKYYAVAIPIWTGVTFLYLTLALHCL